MILKKPRLLCASFVCFFDSSSNRVYCDNATKVMCVANVIFRQERLTVQLLSMHFFYDSSSPSEHFAFNALFL